MTPPPSGYTTGMIAQAVGGELIGPADLPIADFGGLDQAGPRTMSFIRSHRYAVQWATSKAAAAVVTKGLEVPGHDPKTRALVVVPDADLAIITLLELAARQMPQNLPEPGVHPTASVDPTAEVSSSARIGAYCIVGPRTKIGDGVVIQPRVTLGAGVTVGPQTILNTGVVVHDRCVIGAQCVLYSGAVIGSEGFGYRPNPKGPGVIRIPHIGSVVIGNGVEVGSHTCIDRGKFGATTIGDGTKIDNLCQIGHNVRIGRCCIVCGMTGIAGSVVLEDGVVLGGQVGVSDNLRIGAGAQVGALAGVITSIPPGEIWSGRPASPHKDSMRALAALRHLSDHLREHKRAENAKADAAS